MLKTEHKKAQTTVELAIFGAILIFILGTIVRAAVGNGYAQDQNFKAMRMAMLSSWKDSEAAVNVGAVANLSHNNASVLFVEDRLSPDLNKYGDLDRNPYIAQGSGTFSYELEYPWQPGGVDPVTNLLPVMDIYINGQYFPFTTANYVQNRTIIRLPQCDYANGGPFPPPPNGGSLTEAQCLQNQCLRNQREWWGGTVSASQFDDVVPVSALSDTTLAANGNAIFNELVNEGYISLSGSSTTQGIVNASTLSPTFIGWFESAFPGTGQAQINQVQSILQSNAYAYKLFYTLVANGSSQFTTTAPQSCSGQYNGLCQSLTMMDTGANTPYTNSGADMQYDLLRNGNYTNTGDPNSVESQFGGPVTSCSPTGGAGSLRCYIAWQWAASPATDATSIGLDPSSNTYPQYDIDGRLQPVTIYAFSQNPDGTPNVSYEDFQGGDIDETWNTNSCGPKPGLMNDAQIYTFTQAGTYLQIKEGKLYDPETDKFVRSANQTNSVDLIQRMIQLSNNTGRFCDPSSQSEQPPQYLPDGTPNPVEVCIYPGDSDDCFSNQHNFVSTCYDENLNIIFVRSRILNQLGHSWFTDASGKLQVH